MISVIIASVNKELLQAIQKNIHDTIGVPFELLAFDNSIDQRGICAVYNEGMAKARFDLLCFTHEDVAFHTKDWGKTVVDIFNREKNLGVLGIAGSSYKPLTPTGWHGDTAIDTEYSNLIQSFKQGSSDTYHHLKRKKDQNLVKVASVDGVWMCVPKAVAAAVRFDEKVFRGFHCYDLDFCLSVGKTHDVAVTYEVLLQHFSEGNYTREWMAETIKLHKKWCEHLPLYTEPFTARQIYQIERQSFKTFIKKLIRYGFPVNTAFETLYYKKRFSALSKKLFFKLHYYILLSFYLKRNGKNSTTQTKS
jgi:glycosyltransferase involved in cell wall biosynthesis